MSDPLDQLLDTRRELNALRTREARGGGAGAAFPASVAAGFRFFRTDLGLLCSYDGARWLTAAEYVQTLAPYTPTVPGGGFYAGAAPANLAYIVPRADFALYLTRWTIAYTSDTNQTAVNYWTLKLQTNAGDVTTQNTQNAVTAGSLYARGGADNTDRGTVFFLRLQASAKNGAPGGLWATASVYYRLIVP